VTRWQRGEGVDRISEEEGEETAGEDKQGEVVNV